MKFLCTTLALLVFFLSTACQNDYAWVLREDSTVKILPLDDITPRLPVMPGAIRLPEDDAVLYNNPAQGVNIKGQTAGLPPDLDRVYVTLFSAPVGLQYLQKELDERLQLRLQDYGLRMVNRISYAQAIVNGEIRNFDISRAENMTNLTDALFYSFILQVNVQIVKGQEPRFLEPRVITERLLVIDTNRFTSNEVVPILLDRGAQHLAEAVVYGWQQTYGEVKGQEFDVLEYTNESSLLTNRP